MKVRQFEIRGFRSLKKFKSPNLSDLVVLVGKNDSGKSSILQTLRLFFRTGFSLNSLVRGDWDDRDFSDFETNTVHVIVEVEFSDIELQDIKKALEPFYPTSGELDKNLFREFSEFKRCRLKKVLGHKGSIIDSIEVARIDSEFIEILRTQNGRTEAWLLDSTEWRWDRDYLFRTSILGDNFAVSGTQLTQLSRKVIERIFERLSLSIFRLIPPKRQLQPEELTPGTRKDAVEEGKDIKADILEAKNSEDPKLRGLFRTFQETTAAAPFISSKVDALIAKPNVTLTIDEQGLTLRSDKWGSGVQESVIVIWNCLTAREGIIAIEEPEIHLHADGQRFILDFLRSQLDFVQVFLSTHSPTFLDRSNLSSVVLVRKKKDGQTECIELDHSQLDRAIPELGVRNSDFLFADALVFVEGKTDVDAFNTFGQTLQLIPVKTTMEFVPVGGDTKIPPYISLANQMWKLQERLPYFYIVDSHGREPTEVHQELVKQAKEEIARTSGALKIPEKMLIDSIYVLEKEAIESYLLNFRALENVFGIPKDDFISEFGQEKPSFSKIRKFLKEKGIKYRKAVDTPKLAEILRKEEIDEEIVRLLENLTELQSKLS